MEQKSGNKKNEISFVNVARLMFEKTKRENTIYLVKNSFHTFIFIVDVSIVVLIVLIIQTMMQKACKAILTTIIILSSAVEQTMKNVKNVLYDHMATYLYILDTNV
jgi:hypothetical protein